MNFQFILVLFVSHSQEMNDNKLPFNEKYVKLVSKSDGVVQARCQLCDPNKRPFLVNVNMS